MKRGFCSLLVLLLMLSQTFNSFVVINYLVNQEFIANNECENRNNPESSCAGKCFLKKNMISENGSDENKSSLRFLQENAPSFCRFDSAESSFSEIESNISNKVWPEQYALLLGSSNSLDRPPSFLQVI